MSCCVPTAYDGNSTTMVHNFGCTAHPEGTKLSGADMARWRGHPAGTNVAGAPRTDVAPTPVRTTAPVTYGGRPVWHTGPNHCPDCVGWED